MSIFAKISITGIIWTMIISFASSFYGILILHAKINDCISFGGLIVAFIFGGALATREVWKSKI